jgi:putative phosphoesterase
LRIVIISDVHSNLDAFLAVIANLPPYDNLVFLGDLVGYGPQPNEVVDQLRQLHPKGALLGNHDYAVATGDTSGFSPHAEVAVKWTRRHIKQETLDYLSGLHPSARITLNNTRLALFHGSPSDPLSEYIFPWIDHQSAKGIIEKAGSPLVLLGHTHMPMLYSFDEEMLANPGSVGQPRDGDPRASFAILTLSEGKFSFEMKRVEYDIDVVAGKIIRAGLPEFLADRLYTGM